MVVLNKDGGLICAGEEDVLLIQVVSPKFVLRVVPQPGKLSPTVRVK